MRHKRLITLLLTLLCLYAAELRAQVDSDRLYLAQSGQIPWQSLSPEEQAALRRYRGQWTDYDGDRQQELQRGARRYLELPQQKRREVEQQQRQYQNLSPQERQRLREEYQRQHD